MTRPFGLFKRPVQNDTRAIVRHLESIGKPCPPTYIVERNHPSWVPELPTILDISSGETYVGFDRCVRFWSDVTGEAALASFLSDSPK